MMPMTWLVQDTLERACAKSGLWLGVIDMRAWLFGIMHNVHVDGIRRPRLSTVVLDDETPEESVAPMQDDRLAVLDLQAAPEQLPVEQREIMLLGAGGHELCRSRGHPGHSYRIGHVPAAARA